MTSKNDHVRDELLGQEPEWYVGKPADDVPQIPAGEYCNARRNKDGVCHGFCENVAGWGTENEDGRCKLHGGASNGPPKGSQNARTHGLTADPSKYHESLDREGKEFVLDVSAAIEDRIREIRGDVDYVDRVLVRRIAIKLHIVANATGYINRNGLTETVFTDDGQFDKESPLLPVLRQYDREIWNEMRDLGLLDDPESQKADALTDWRRYIEVENP